MNIQQLRSICELARNGYSISAAARTLHTSQPAISKQIRQLEAELGAEIFSRLGKRLVEPTRMGDTVIALAKGIVSDVEQIRLLSARPEPADLDPIIVATTHTQARYFLPPIIKEFNERYPYVRIVLWHGEPQQIADWILQGTATLAVAMEDEPTDDRLASLPCQQFPRVVVVPARHPLLKLDKLTLADIGPFPLIFFEGTFTRIVRTFESAGIRPQLALSAIDSDVIKTCIEHGLGIAVLSAAVFDSRRDRKLRAIPAGHLFEPSTTRVLVRRHRLLRRFEFDFVRLCTPQSTKKQIEQAVR